MGILNIDLNNGSLDDTNYNEDEPEKMVEFLHVRRLDIIQNFS